MQIHTEIIRLQPRHVFRISRGAKAEVENVIFTLSGEGFTGLGEASPNLFYHESAQDVARRLADLTSWLEEIRISQPSDIFNLWPEVWRRVKPSRAAACAVDLALWDWLAQAKSTTLSKLLWGEEVGPITSCVTLGLSELDELAEKLLELAPFPILKIKLSRTDSVELVSQIRQQTQARLLVDANAAWDATLLHENAPRLAELGVELIEQPLPPGAHFLAPACGIPIFADESCVIPEDIDHLPNNFSGFNLKLVKCGGITPALDLLERGKKRGLRSMVGCMLESSVLISAGYAIAQRTDYADLDGSWLLQDEPYGRTHFDRGILSLS